MKKRIILNQSGIQVDALYDEETTKVTVLKGSKIRSNIVESLQEHIKKLRKKVINDSTIMMDYTFKKDYEFSSLFTAASFCLGRSVNGRDVFKLENGQSIGTIFKEIPSLIDYIKDNLFKYREKLGIAEQERRNFLNYYPLEKLKYLRLDEYDKLNDSNTFMNFIEYKTKNVVSGHLATNNNKLFFHSRMTNSYQMAKVISNDVNNKGTIEEIFKKYMLEYYDFVNTFDMDNYNAKDYLYGTNVLKMNLILLYKGPIFTSIVSIDRIRRILDYLGIDYDEINDSVGLNIILTKYLYEKEPNLRNESLYCISYIISDYYNEYINNELRYYLGGFIIDDIDRKNVFINQNIYAIGYSRLGNLKDYDSDEDILNKFQELYPDITLSHFKQTLKYLKNIKKGDKIALKSCFYSKTDHSVTRIFAVGEFKSSFDEDYSYIQNLGHALPVEWQYVFKVPKEISTAYMKNLQIVKDKNIINLMKANSNMELDFPEKISDFDSVNVLYYGVPGCGKSYQADVDAKKYDDYERILFHPDYSYADFVGQIQPKLVNDKLTYTFEPGPFTKILKEALSNPSKEYVLIIEEINRGNAPAIFGDIFQLLDRLKEDKDGYSKGDSEYRIKNDLILDYLKDVDYDSNEIYIPNNLSLFATMNSNDQNVFVLDTAFKRRWKFKRMSNVFEETHPYRNQLIAGTNTTWRKFVDTINAKIISLNTYGINGEDKRIGKYFMSKQELNDKEAFAEKILLYLWEDVVKFDRTLLFKDEYTTLDELIDGYMNYGLKVFKDIFDGEVDEE